MNPVLLCLDSGTTAVKAAAFDRHGRLVAMAQGENTALRRDGSLVEQDMDVTCNDAFSVLKACVDKLSGPVEGLVVTGQGDGMWPLDSGGSPVGKAITWLDGRAKSLAAALQQSGDLEAIEAVTFSRPTAASQSLHLLWLQQNDPARLARIAHVLRLKEWLFLRLTGKLMGEPGAALPVWGNWRTGEVSAIVEEALGLDRGAELLPELLPVGACRAALSQEAASAVGLPSGVPVLLGPGDVQSALIGLGLGSSAGVSGASIFGTSAIHARWIEDPGTMRAKPPGAMVQQFALGAGYLCFHPSFNGATLLQHIARLTGQSPGPVAPAYSAILLHPFFEPGGERAPCTSPHASGAILGVTATTRPEELAWAGREALAFIARMSHDMMSAAPGKAAGDLALGGGLAADGDFAGFLSTTLSQKVRRKTGGNAGLIGLAAIGAKFLLDASREELGADWIGEADETVSPGTGEVAAYSAAKYAIFEDMLVRVSPLWAEISQLGERAGNLMKGQDT